MHQQDEKKFSDSWFFKWFLDNQAALLKALALP